MRSSPFYEKNYRNYLEKFKTQGPGSNRENTIFRLIEKFLWIVSFSLFVYILKLMGTNFPLLLLISYCFTAGAFLSFAIHFHCSNKLTELIGKRHGNELIEWERLESVKIHGKIGRYSHMFGFFCFTGAMTTFACEIPVFFGLLPVLAIMGYVVVFRGYGALYAAMQDYILE